MNARVRLPTVLVLLAALTMPLHSQELEAVVVPAPSRLSIELDSGDLHITGSNRNVVECVGELDVTGDETQMTITRSKGSASPVTVALPEGVSLTVRVGTGDIRLVATRGVHDIRVENGDVSLARVAGTVRVSVGRGSIAGDLYPDGGGRLETTRGDVDVRLRDEPRAELDVSAAEGAVRLIVPESLNAELDVRTDDGDIRSHLETALNLASDGATKRAAGTLGVGGALIRVAVARGDVELDADAESGYPKRQRLLVPVASDDVVIDGEFETAWSDSDSLPLGTFDALDGEVRALRDTARLLVYAALPVSDWSAVAATASEPDDGRIVSDDVFDALFAVDGNVFRVSVNALGSVYDAQIQDDVENAAWSGEVTAGVRILPTAWVVEMAISLAALGIAAANGVELDADFEIAPSSGDIPVSTEARLFFGSSAEGDSLPLSVTGNDTVPPNALLRAVGVRTNGTIRESEIPVVETNLRRLGWFARASVARGDASVFVELGERAAFEVREIRFLGFRAVPESFARDRLGWRTGWTTDDTVDALRQLTETYYRAQGCDIATVKTWLAGSALFVDADEGIIEDLVVTGASRLEPSAVVRRMAAVIGVPYNAEAVSNALAEARTRLREEHSAFRDLVNDEPEQVDGRWTLRLRVTETKPLKAQVIPAVRYLSVHGWELGAFARVRREGGKVDAVAELSRVEGIRRRDGDDYAWNYRVGLLVRLTPNGGIALGTDWSRKTTMPVWQGTGSLMDSSVAFLAGGGSAAYYGLVSNSHFLRLFASSRAPFDIGFSIERADTLRRIVRRSAFGNNANNDNRPIDDGDATYAFARWSLDGRDRRTASVDPLATLPPPSVSVRNGVFVGLSAEAGTLNPRDPPGATKKRGEQSFYRVGGDMRVYVAFGDRASADARVRGQWTRRFLPSQLGVWLGGGNTLPGWKESLLFGDSGVAVSVELRRRLAEWGLFVAGFGDGGFVRPAKGAWRFPASFDVGVGVGVELGGLGGSSASASGQALGAELVRVDVAFPVTELVESRAPNVVLRLNRRF